MSTKRSKLYKDLYPGYSRQQSVSYLSLASNPNYQLRYLLTATDIAFFLSFGFYCCYVCLNVHLSIFVFGHFGDTKYPYVLVLNSKKNFSSFFKHFFKCVVIAVMIMKTVVVLTLAFVACFMLQPVGSVVSSIFCMKQLRQH